MLTLPTRYPRAVLGAWLVLMVAALAALTRLEINTDTRVFFDSSSPQIAALKEFEEKYTAANTAFLAVTLPLGASLIDPTVQQLLTGLSDAAWRIPGILRVDALSNYQHARSTGETLEIRELFGDSLHSPRTAEALDALVDANPALVGLLISQDYRHAGLNLTFELPGQAADAQLAIEEINLGLDEIVNEFLDRNHDYQIHRIGMLPLIHTFGVATLRDLTTLIPLALNVSGLMLLLFLRSFRLAGPILLSAIGAALISSALWALVEIPFNVATAIAPVIVMSLTLAAGVHVVLSCLHKLELKDWSRSVEEGVRSTVRPSLLAWLTTSLGFIAFNAADAPPFRELGNFVVIGVSIGYLAVYSLLPAVSVLLGPPAQPGPAWPGNLGRWVAQHQRVLFLVCIAASIMLVAGVSRLTLDDQFSSYFDRSFEYRQAIEFIEPDFTGSDVIEIDVPHPAGGVITDPEYVLVMARWLNLIRELPDVKNAVGVSDIIFPIHRAMAPASPFPRAEAVVNEYLFLYELGLPPGKELGHWVAMDRSASRVSVVVADQTSQGLKSVQRSITRLGLKEGYFDKFNFTGLSLLYANLSSDNVAAMILATAVSLLLIACIVAVVLRSPKLGFACLAASLLPLAVGFGIWGWSMGVVGLPGAVIVALTIGIIVDDAIHFIYRYESQRSRGGSHASAVIHAVATAGQAMLLTSICLLIGFLILGLSGFQINQHVGIFSCVVFVLAFVFNVFALPRVLGLSRVGQVFNCFANDR